MLMRDNDELAIEMAKNKRNLMEQMEDLEDAKAQLENENTSLKKLLEESNKGGDKSGIAREAAALAAAKAAFLPDEERAALVQSLTEAYQKTIPGL